TSIPDTFTPFLPRPIFSFQHAHTLNDNCARSCNTVPKLKCFHFAHTTRAFFWWYLITPGVFIFC
ncbi:unnamed protein product, partial [Staurois parvus]